MMLRGHHAADRKSSGTLMCVVPDCSSSARVAAVMRLSWPDNDFAGLVGDVEAATSPRRRSAHELHLRAAESIRRKLSLTKKFARMLWVHANGLE